MKKVLSTLVGASVLATGGISLSATDVGALTLANGTTTCSISNLDGATHCEGAYAGNDSNQSLDGLFGINGWTEVVKTEDDTNEGNVFDSMDGSWSNTGMGVTLTVNTIGGTSGTWSATGLDYSNYDYVAVLKGGPTFSAYKLADFTIGGNWDTSGILTGGQNPQPSPGLSHFTLYKTPGTAVPEPLTILGAGAAISFGTAFKRKLGKAKKSNEKA
ncbi:hypothetical protein cce_0879 [Crocosphaera subtropica ATCC 51142]|uniref:PEP-CTERM protein-sorting domain-containing protein n=1 Tax=Crocosphaera subtropica (strain ATCC 51142 / BH68) TaxID=43989 RepID=B1WS36_CROS5|nr:PEP-CTERM sorting domain-containing protein [Crocosphaera subtropica]ACB50230.1 hypothetical protein cce_0879 [Crocosphaera subtropica ATCC 51142]